MLDLNKENGSTDQIRRAKDAKIYAEATKEVGKEFNLPVLDVWSAFMEVAAWKGTGILPGSEELGKSNVLAGFLHDGELSFYEMCSCKIVMGYNRAPLIFQRVTSHSECL